MGYSLYHIFVFADTFMIYAALHALREGWSYSKTDITNQFDVSKKYLGIVDALFLVCYSSGMVVLGSIMHKFSLKNYVLMGITVSSITYMIWMILYSISGFYNVVLMTVLMCINGFFQATGWPGVMAIFSTWFAGHKKGFLMGVWACNANVGNIIAQALLNLLEDYEINFVWNFVLTGGLGLLMALATFFFLKQKPEETSTTEKNQSSLIEQPKQTITSMGNSEVSNESESNNQTTLKYGIFSVLCIPKVPIYVGSYACLKGCIYGLLFWLPTLLDDHPGPISDQKGYISSMFDIGAVAGALLFGFLADFFNKRALFLSPSLLVCAVVMFLISFTLSQAVWGYYLTIFLIGFFISGPYNMIATLMVIELGSTIKQKGGIAKLSSLNEGLAALLTTIQMIVIPHLDSSIVFYLFAAECLIATLLLFPPFLKELREVKQNKLVQQQQQQIQETK